MRRQFLGVVSLCFALTLAGCGDKAKVEPPDTGGETGALTDPLGPDSDNSTSDPEAKTGSSEKHDHDHPHSHDQAIEGRTTLNGNWLLAFAQLVPPQQEGQEFQAGERTVLLFNVTGAGTDSASMSVIAGRQNLEQVNISDFEVSDETIQFQANMSPGEKVFEFSGQLKQGLVIGTCLFADGMVAMARLLPTEEKTFARIPAMIPLPETQMFIQLGSSPVPDEDTRHFVEILPASPLGRMAYIRLINVAAGNKEKPEELESLISEYIETMKDWGELAVAFTTFESFSAVAMAGYDAEWCLARADEVEKVLQQHEELDVLQRQVETLRKQVKYRQTTELLKSKDESERQQARELAEVFLKETPFEPVLSVLLADDARENNRTDEAIRRYAELVAFPMQERLLQQYWQNEPVQKILPFERLATLWKEKHGGTDGLDEYINEVYHEELLSFADDPVEATEEDASRHTVLCELFTGSRCPPCVAADVGLEAIEKTYPQSQVITLRYHVHVPGHDPLTNDDCEARYYNFYKVKGTPSLYIDGMQLGGVAGVMANAPQTYRGIRNVIDEFRGVSKPESGDNAADSTSGDDSGKSTDAADAKADDQPDASAEVKEKSETRETDDDAATAESEVVSEPKITIDLKASRQQDTIQVAASVKGVTPEMSNVRLMLVLAESDISYQAFNGIRHHDMVVRQLIGGDRGINPKDGVLAYQGTVNVEELRDRLHAYLTEFEENQGVEFVSMPLELKNLSVVAFVQQVDTRKVLQSVVIPVTGAVTAE